MGAEDRWRDRLPVRRPQRWLGRDDRSDHQRRRSQLLLVMGAALALAATYLARSLPSGTGAAHPAVPTTAIVVAAADIGFGERLTPEKLKLVDLPVPALPAGHFQQLEPLLQPSGHSAMRPIAANEVITAQALAAGATRLSTAPLLNPTMRALSVAVDEIAGVSGLITPGDRVDVLMTHQPEAAMPHAELIAQAIRVLAVGADMNIARDQPGAAKTITLELTPGQAQKLTLAAATGQISLALRQFSDDDRIRLESLQVSDLNDGTPTRLVRKPGSASPGPSPSTRLAPGPSVTVMRAGAASVEPVQP